METVTFGTLNYAILGLYLLGMVSIGLFFARRQESAEMFFLGGRKLPWLAVAMSMYASLTSAVTYLGLPALPGLWGDFSLDGIHLKPA